MWSRRILHVAIGSDDDSYKSVPRRSCSRRKPNQIHPIKHYRPCGADGRTFLPNHSTMNKFQLLARWRTLTNHYWWLRYEVYYDVSETVLAIYFRLLRILLVDDKYLSLRHLRYWCSFHSCLFKETRHCSVILGVWCHNSYDNATHNVYAV
jgi:hypothetical protein